MYNIDDICVFLEGTFSKKVRKNYDGGENKNIFDAFCKKYEPS